MLFALVDDGKLTLDEAADIAGMTWGNAVDMLQGWQESQKMQERGERYKDKLMDWKLL